MFRDTLNPTTVPGNYPMEALPKALAGEGPGCRAQGRKRNMAFRPMIPEHTSFLKGDTCDLDVLHARIALCNLTITAALSRDTRMVWCKHLSGAGGGAGAASGPSLLSSNERAV